MERERFYHSPASELDVTRYQYPLSVSYRCPLAVSCHCTAMLRHGVTRYPTPICRIRGILLLIRRIKGKLCLISCCLFNCEFLLFVRYVDK